MKIQNIITGMIIAAIGVAIGYLDYSIVSAIYNVSMWISGLLNAPESLAVILTIIVSWVLLGLLLILAIITIYVVLCGLILVLSD